jgi:hypothetical protein
LKSSTIAPADSFVPDFDDDQGQALRGMENGGAGKLPACSGGAASPPCRETSLRRLLLIILLLMIASVFSILWIKPQADSTRPSTPQNSVIQ